MGGTITFATAARLALGAAVTFYGGGVAEGRFGFPPLVELAPSLRTPWLGLYGDLDTGIPVEQVESLRAAVAGAAVDAEIVRYPEAEHGFNCDERASFHAAVGRRRLGPHAGLPGRPPRLRRLVRRAAGAAGRSRNGRLAERPVTRRRVVPMSGGVVAEGLVKRFGDFTALGGVDFMVPEGTIVGLLGPNGAGKTTTIRILTTLLEPDAGHATVAGYDVRTQAALVRAVIGLTGQYAAVDQELSGRENLVLIGRLSRLTKRQARERAEQLLVAFSLTDAAERSLRTYSGGMRRRLDLACSLMVSPPVLFLDEPTTGLDPRSRLELWDVIVELARPGHHHRAHHPVPRGGRPARREHLGDRRRPHHRRGHRRRAQDHGRRRRDRPAGGRTASGSTRPPRCSPSCSRPAPTTSSWTTTSVGCRSRSRRGAGALAEVVRNLDGRQITIADLAIRRPSLDDVFMALTGHPAEEDPNEPVATGAPRTLS